MRGTIRALQLASNAFAHSPNAHLDILDSTADLNRLGMLLEPLEYIPSVGRVDVELGMEDASEERRWRRRGRFRGDEKTPQLLRCLNQYLFVNRVAK